MAPGTPVRIRAGLYVNMEQEQPRTLRSHLEENLNCNTEDGEDTVEAILDIADLFKADGRHKVAKKLAKEALDYATRQGQFEGSNWEEFYMPKESAPIEKLKVAITNFYTENGLTFNKEYIEDRAIVLDFVKETPGQGIEVSIETQPSDYRIIVIENAKPQPS